MTVRSVQAGPGVACGVVAWIVVVRDSSVYHMPERMMSATGRGAAGTVAPRTVADRAPLWWRVTSTVGVDGARRSRSAAVQAAMTRGQSAAG
ncbi:hypothetical protein GCM10017581_084440 [Dactylosporangium matsuzakiense]|uniref:Uncharacterized protein n=1 Tax=Dactylosporangium matsuzakiense TaxID=53360 RepID=A0A9W6KU16_9ACTN|nr:hypothetical protein GCM10017581_084440 [Dactylosporangium matsuzakiense]